MLIFNHCDIWVYLKSIEMYLWFISFQWAKHQYYLICIVFFCHTYLSNIISYWRIKAIQTNLDPTSNRVWNLWRVCYTFQWVLRHVWPDYGHVTVSPLAISSDFYCTKSFILFEGFYTFKISNYLCDLDNCPGWA